MRKRNGQAKAAADQVDWVAVRFEYEFTTQTIKKLARRLGISEWTVKKRCQDEHWQKKMATAGVRRLSDDDKETLRTIAAKALETEPHHPVAQAGLITALTFEELRDRVVNAHYSAAERLRKHLEALGEDAMAFRGRLNAMLDGLDISEQAELIDSAVRTSRDLASALEKVVNIERQALALDLAPIDPTKSYEDFLRMGMELPDGTVQSVEIGRRPV